MIPNSKKAVSLAGVVATSISLLTSNVMAIDYKHVAVAPQDIYQQKIQAANTKGVFSDSTMIPITTANIKGNQLEHTIYFDGIADSPVILLSPQADEWSMSLVDPRGKLVYDEHSLKNSTVQSISIGDQSFDGKSVQLSKPLAGEWTVRLTREVQKRAKPITPQTKPLGYLMYQGDPSLQAYTYLDNNYTIQNSEVNLAVRMVDASIDGNDRQMMLAKQPLIGRIDKATVSITYPSGENLILKLNDQGLKGDKYAGDGIFGVKLPTNEVGAYIQQVQIEGVNGYGRAFTRTTTDLYSIAPQHFEFAQGSASIAVDTDQQAVIKIPVNKMKGNGQQDVYLSTELWGTNAKGQLQAATWIGGVVAPVDGDAALRVDTRWLSRLGLSAPFALKDLRIQDLDSNVPVAAKTSMPLEVKGKLLTSKSLTSSVITDEMLMGKAPQRIVKSAGGSKLLLVHGYCSGQAWLESHFNDADEFQDYNQSISHDTFARRVQAFGEQYDSFGVVAHSQGGAASLTLYARYWSGLDYASSGDLIQSVGTPYQGTSLAGNLAAIGSIFGVGCGKNTDLTYSGASNWLATVPSWARAKVNYFTTSFTDKWWRYDYCHIASDLLLTDPDDGTTEKWSGQLSGGVNRGHTQGQCHTGGMRDPAQTKDTSRNSTMSNRAAR